MAVRHVAVKDFDLPTLRQIGLAVQYFPDYHRAASQQSISHDILYASFLADGKATHQVAGDSFEERAGSLAVVGYDVPHEIITPNGPVAVYNIYLDPRAHAMPALPPPLQNCIYELLPLHHALVSNHNCIRHLQFDTASTLQPLLDGILREQHTAAAGYQEAMLHWFALFLTRCARALHRQGLTLGPTPSDPDMSSLQSYLDRHLTTNHSLDQLAARCGLSKEQCCRRFKRHAGMSPIAYINQRRIEAAMIALRSSSHRILDIALETGFQDLSYFNRQFKKTTGTTPRAYRANLQSQ